MSRTEPKRVIVAGTTGLVGSAVVEQAAADPMIGSTIALTRRRLDSLPDRVQQVVVDFEALSQAELDWRADLMVIALGTTIRKAGSQEAFAKVDRDYVLSVAEQALQAGTPACAVVSSIGANAKSRAFYPRLKGEVELALQNLGFARLVILRPSLLTGQRAEKRLGEQWSIRAMTALQPLTPRRWRPIAARSVAAGLLRHGLVNPAEEPGRIVLESDQI